MKTLSLNDKLLTIKDVSELLDVSEVTVKRHVSKGTIPSIKVGNARRIKPEAINNFLNNPALIKAEPKRKELKIIPGYMGIKTQILDQIHLEIKKIAQPGEIILDIFAGSGAVGYELKKNFTIYSNDIESYSCVVNKLLIDNTLSIDDINEFNLSSFEEQYSSHFQSLRTYVSVDLDKYKENPQLFPYVLFTEYFSDTYFGRTQSMQIDSLRYAIDQSEPRFKNLLLSCLIFACYQTVTSVGSHFAQPKIAKLKNQPDIEKKRNLDVKDFFIKKLQQIKDNLIVTTMDNKVFCSDFKSLFSNENLNNVSVTYIDPPYTIDHYSRFYHILNSLVLYDYPDRVGKGQYRTDRYQSNFCIKTKVINEFDDLVKRISSTGSKIVMSYSDSYRSLMTIDQILTVLRQYYKAGSVKTPIKIEYNYSGFGQSASNKANELLFIATEPK